MNFAHNLKHLLQKTGISQQELADKLGVTMDTVGYWEVGITNPNLKDLERIVTALETTLGELIK